jgi:STE24 endopeptidase
LGDTLLQNRSREEIEAVLAHEIGHHIQKHMLKLTLVNLVTSFLLFYALNALMTRFSGFPNNLPSTFTLFPLFILFSGVLSVPMRVGLNAYSRLKEKEADRTALDLTGKKEAFIRVMAGLANKNLSVAYPKPYKVVLSYSHPPVGKRIQFAQTYVANSMANTKLVP